MKPSYSKIRFLFDSSRTLAMCRRELRYWLNPRSWVDPEHAAAMLRSYLGLVKCWRICYRNDLSACLR